ncbi:MAG: zf-HC2 domain-containing protein [Polyangiaceae bacterium]
MSNAARKLSSESCKVIAPALDTFLDGELDPCQIVAVESHMAECPSCRERVALDRATRSSLRQKMCAPAPVSLRERVAAAAAAERAREAAGEVAPADSLRSHSNVARMAVPVAIAAGVALAFSLRAPRPANDAQRGVALSDDASNAAVSLTLDGIIDDLINLHARPLPPEVTRAEDLRAFDPFVGVKVEPPKLQPFGARFDGARMLPIRDQRAAMLQYGLADGHRVTLYVFDSKRVPNISKNLREHVVRNGPVYTGKVRGYNVATTERRGVGYALATDLDEPQSIELAAAAAPLVSRRFH